MLKKYLNSSKHIQRLVLTSFVVTFACARIIVLLIMTRDIPDLYLHVGGIHVHHLNYGIFFRGSYWQRASFDAITIIGGILLLAAYTPPTHWIWRRFAGAMLIILVLIVFCWRLSITLVTFEKKAFPKLERIENKGPN